MFENDPAYEKFTRLKQENITISCSSISFIFYTWNAFAFQTKVHLFVSPSRQTTLNSALQRALKHFNNACSTTRGSILSDPLTTTMTSISTTKVKNKKQTNLANKQATHQTSLFPTTDRKSTILNSFLIRPTYQISHYGKNTAICRSCA